jgi:YD repeat-containing protein
VKGQLGFVGSFILLFSIAASGTSGLINGQTTASGAASETKSPPMSDREQHGLRDLVKTCVEETNYPGATAADGRQIPERKSWYKTDYDVEGRIISTRMRNSDGSEWVTRDTFDASGHLLKSAWGNEGEPTTERVYSYDDQGRLLNITDSRTPDNPVTFRYDERGRKTKVQASRPADYQPNTAVAGSPFQVADMAPNLPGGGSATTVYDEHDRPVEVQVRDARGELVSRAVRIYDAQGRVTEEKQILDNPETIIPAEAREKILEESGGSREELREQLREQLTKLMGGHAGPFSIAYSYDAQGRVQQTRRRIFNEEAGIETTYNEHGDKAAEITRSTEIGSEKEQSASRVGLPSYSEVRYSYQYDDHDNWTEEIVSYRSSPGGVFESSSGRRRTLTYY